MRRLLLLLLWVFMPALLWAQPTNPNARVCNVTAVSTAEADVQAAVNAAKAGMVICVPAGTSAWSTPVTVTGNNLVIIGDGPTRTIITVNGFTISGTNVVVLGMNLTSLPGCSSAITTTVMGGADLQAAINAAVPCTILQLQAGATFTGNYTLPNKAANMGTIELTTTAAAGSLPAPGVRTGPSYTAFMPTLQSSNTSPALATVAGANHYLLRHVAFGPNPQGFYTVLNLGFGDSQQQFASQQPTDILIDQCYLTGDPIAGQQRGIELEGVRLSVTNSYLENFHSVGQDGQCIAGWNGHGPYTITNNYLQCATETILFGGADPAMSTWMHVTGTPTTTGADVTQFYAGHSLSELWVGQHLGIRVNGTLQFAALTVIDVGDGTHGHLTWAPALTAAPLTSDDIRGGVVLGDHGDTTTIARNHFTKNPYWQFGIVPRPTNVASSITGGGSLTGTHYYQVQAWSANGYEGGEVNSQLSLEQTQTLGSPGSVTLTWTAALGATSYQMWRGTSPGVMTEWAHTTSSPGPGGASVSFMDDGSTPDFSAYTPSPIRPAVKNLFELKAALHLDLTGNVYDYDWQSGGSNGNAIWEVSADQDGGGWFVQTAYITHHEEIVRHVPGWIAINGTEIGGPSLNPDPAHDLTYRNILVYDSSNTWADLSSCYAFTLQNSLHDLVFDHLTIIQPAMLGALIMSTGETLPMKNLSITNSLMQKQTYGILGDAVGLGVAALDAYFPGPTWTFTYNGFADGTGGTNPPAASNQYPAEATWESYFTAYTPDGVGADYHVKTSSPFYHAGNDGKSLGADIDAILSATAGVAP